MKKILFGSAVAILLLLLLSSCSSYKYTARQTDVERQNIVMAPAVVDVIPDYSVRIEVSSKWCRTQEEAMNECRYNAINNRKVDVVVDPIFKIEMDKTRGARKYKANLIGFGGYYSNYRTLYEDIALMKNLSREDIEKYMMIHHPAPVTVMAPPSEAPKCHQKPQCPKKILKLKKNK